MCCIPTRLLDSLLAGHGKTVCGEWIEADTNPSGILQVTV